MDEAEQMDPVWKNSIIDNRPRLIGSLRSNRKSFRLSSIKVYVPLPSWAVGPN